MSYSIDGDNDIKSFLTDPDRTATMSTMFYDWYTQQTNRIYNNVLHLFWIDTKSTDNEAMSDLASCDNDNY